MRRPCCPSLRRIAPRPPSPSSYSLSSPVGSSSVFSLPVSPRLSCLFSPSVCSPSSSVSPDVTRWLWSSSTSRTFSSSSSVSFLRRALRRFVLHFSPPAASPFPQPSLAEKRRFLRYRLLQYQQHAKQQKISWTLFEGHRSKGDRNARTRRVRGEEAEAEAEPRQTDAAKDATLRENVRENSEPLSRSLRGRNGSGSPSGLPSSSSFAASFSASFSSSFVDPRWRDPALWPARRLLPPPPPPPEYVFAKSETHTEGRVEAERGDKGGGRGQETGRDREEKTESALPLRVHAVGHGTFLLQCGGINVLTDPFFAAKAGPFGVLGLPRVSQPGISLESLPPIDVVLLSSVRFDAYDHAALRFLAKRDGSTFFVPNGVLARRYLSPRVFGNVYPMNWGDRVKFDENFLVFFCPAVHAAVGRYGVDWNVPGWGSFAVQWCAKERRGALVPSTKSVFFGGRSAYSRKMFDLIREGTRRDRETLRQEMETEAAFQREMERERRIRRGEEAVEEELVEEAAETEVGQRKGGGGEEGGDRFVFDLAILPVGGYEPREYMRRYQMSPEEAVEAHLRLESKLSLPSHFDVLPVGSEAFREAPSRLIAACNAKGVPVGGFTEHSDFDFSFKGSQKTDAGNGAGTAAQKATGYDKSSGEQGGFHILEPGAHFWVL
uniref:Beta-lactamase superfamily domain protein n=1 Tax=Toxoplasma gondii COUG TaxID=1074873 RepID=A0A2G8Y7M9_TOXGO|nr:beta-lactamase superfamily domain protein [Toxoplasma gondii COUG]